MVHVARVHSLLRDLLCEEDGMEMVEWSIVGVVFALAGAILWTTLNRDVGTAMGKLGTCVETGDCGQQGQ
jgi:Flp pilus assembly pilin Flp